MRSHWCFISYFRAVANIPSLEAEGFIYFVTSLSMRLRTLAEDLHSLLQGVNMVLALNDSSHNKEIDFQNCKFGNHGGFARDPFMYSQRWEKQLDSRLCVSGLASFY